MQLANKKVKYKAYNPYPFDVTDSCFVDVYVVSNGHPCHPSSGEEKYDWTLLEYTGVSDINDIDIYHGDIVMYRNDMYDGTECPDIPHNDFGVILWDDKTCGWIIDSQFKDNVDKFIEPLNKYIKLKIIGHVLDDQENFMEGYIGDK